MKAIWKYELSFNGITKFQIPKGGKILTAQKDQKTNRPCLFVLVNTEKQTEERIISLFGTGGDIGDDIETNGKYIGTYQYQNGAFIGHLFELLTDKK